MRRKEKCKEVTIIRAKPLAGLAEGRSIVWPVPLIDHSQSYLVKPMCAISNAIRLAGFSHNINIAGGPGLSLEQCPAVEQLLGSSNTPGTLFSKLFSSPVIYAWLPNDLQV